MTGTNPVLSLALVVGLVAAPNTCPAKGFTETILYNFTGGADGGDPASGLTKVGTMFYGTTATGGAFGFGTVFSVTESGALTTLYSFKGYPDASGIEWPLIYKDGLLYGTSRLGGDGASGPGHQCKHDSKGGCGTVFEVTLDRRESILYAFSNTKESDGTAATGSLVELGGKFYGVTGYGGKSGYGTIFSVTKSGKEKVLYSFPNENYGIPVAGLTVLNDVLYGTAAGANAQDYGPGAAFSITPEGVFTVLHQFSPPTDGSYPLSPLLPLNGVLYGTTELGGQYGKGVLYSLTTAGVETLVTSFSGRTVGPYGGLLAKGKNIYGDAKKRSRYLHIPGI